MPPDWGRVSDILMNLDQLIKSLTEKNMGKSNTYIFLKFYLHCGDDQQYSEINTDGSVKVIMGKEVSGIGNDVANNGWDEISQRGAHEVSTKPKDDGYPLRLDICN